MGKRISYSQLSMFSNCPHRWKLNYIDGLRLFESNIYLIFGTAMHEVLQTYLEVMYNDTIKRADMLNLDTMLRDKLIEQFKKAEEEEGKAPCLHPPLTIIVFSPCSCLSLNINSFIFFLFSYLLLPTIAIFIINPLKMFNYFNITCYTC